MKIPLIFRSSRPFPFIVCSVAALGVSWFVFSLFFNAKATPAFSPKAISELKLTINKLKPLHQKISKPGPNDWLARHKEPGQTFEQYLQCNPITPQGNRTVLYIQPIGDFTETQRTIINLTADYMRRFFNLEVKINKSLPLSVIPKKARRVHPIWRNKQILSTYILDHVLKPNLPSDAAAIIGFTAQDLWPGKGWNFVFGQASIRERIGVWSIHRNGNPDKNEKSFKLCLKRTIKIAVHETGHMFSMLHCTAYECCMRGCNNQAEADKIPLYLCPECNAKICLITQTDPITRYKKLIDFCQKNGFEQERLFFEKSISKLKK